MNTQEELLEGVEQPQLRCHIGFSVTKDDKIMFDCLWMDDEDLPYLIKLIQILDKNFITQKIKEMETENKEEVKVILGALHENKPVIAPLNSWRTVDEN